MARKIKKIFVIICMLTLVCMFFPLLETRTANAAAIEAVSGNKFILTGLAGYSPQHFFVDDEENSTLVNVDVKDKGEEYYSLVAKGKGTSSGWSELKPPVDMQPFIEKGLLYAQATATISTKKDTSVTIKISSGTKEEKVSGTSGQISTPMLKIEKIENIRFSFEANSKGKESFTISVPTIHIYTEIDEVVLNEVDQKVAPGQVFDVDAYNEVTKITGVTGNFVSFSKINHEIGFEFKQGGKLCSVVKSNLVISENAKNGDVIEFRVFANKNSYSSEKIYSTNYVTLTVDSSMFDVKVRTDFEEPAVFSGEGLHAEGKMFTMSVTPKTDFEFLGWYIDGEFWSNKNLLVTTATHGQDIYAKFRKLISISSVQVAPREYDGTNVIDPSSVTVTFDGLEGQHELSIEGVSYFFADVNVGKNKLVNSQFDEIVLSGKDADLYSLKTQYLPDGIGEILKRDAKILPSITQKEYGYTDPIIDFTTVNVVEGELLSGNLGREAGEALGKYKISIGDLIEKNLNYNLTLEENDAYFEIVQRKIELANVLVEDKEFDGKVDATVTASLRNVFNDEDVYVTVSGEFVSADAGMDKEVKITDAQLQGADKDNYILEQFTQTVFGNISPKPISVKAEDATFEYGEPVELSYSAQGLLGEDVLSGNLSIDSLLVGKHQIVKGNLAHPNYVIENFESAICTITPRKAYVTADDGQSKVYGEKDQNFSYKVTNLLDGDVLVGKLMRAEGEDVGAYELNKGTLSNPNYEIVFEESTFNITPREITARVEFLDKEYDGTDYVQNKTMYFNNETEEEFELVLTTSLSSVNCGEVEVIILDKAIKTQKRENFTFIYQFINTKITIRPRMINIFVDQPYKTYGDSDPVFTFTIRNLLAGDNVYFSVRREEGEDAGLYKFYLENVVSDNPNYQVNLLDLDFEILPKQIFVHIEDYSKTFGDPDPKLEYTLSEDYSQTILDLIEGDLARQEGESVGEYAFDLSKITSNKNYVFVNDCASKFTITKKPVTVTCKPSEKVYGNADPDFEYVVDGEVEGEELHVLILRDEGENVGEYSYICAATNDSRYEIQTFIGASLTIKPYTVSIKADSLAKIYGDADPVLTVSVTDGILKNNDRIENIINGKLTRESGEDVGTYKISFGESFSLGKNYNIATLEEGIFQIFQRHITVKVLKTCKVYGEDDPDLEYEVLADGVAPGERVEVKLKREAGEKVGVYAITQEEISINPNYIVDFIGGNFEILKREIQIIPTTLSKEYGEEDTPIKYQISGTLIGNDKLEGELYRDKAAVETIGKYKIHCTLSNDNYDIKFNDYYFTILPREIVVKANSYEILYGESDPAFEYQILSGEILPGDEITGSLQRMNGVAAGSYDILSTLTLGKNYHITFIRGTLKILPLTITIKSDSYSKVYGREDPTFDYTIVEGTLINQDKLYGALSREEGEDVGTYALVQSLYNSNYQITLLPAQLEIVKKDVYLNTSIYNKIYDGTTFAQLKNPYISGIIDDVFLEYDKYNSAEFETAGVGKDKKVFVHDITLSGEKCNNYNLILPDVLYADITLNEIGTDRLTVSSKDPILYEDYELSFSSQQITEDVKIKNHVLVQKLDIALVKGSRLIDEESTYTIKTFLLDDISTKSNIYVYQKLEDGSFALVTSEMNEYGQITITSSSLGEFYITVEDETWMDIAFIISIFMIAAVALLAFIIFDSKSQKRTKNA